MVGTDKELADALIDRGIGFRLYANMIAWPDDNHYILERSFVRDWRIAGACLERWPTTINTEHLNCTLDEMLRNPRAIIEAWCVALEPV